MEKLFSDTALLVPARLHSRVLQEGFRPERQTAIYLIYDLIVQKCGLMKGKWTHISDQAFGNLVKNHTRKSVEKRWLEENGFIRIKKWKAKDGTWKNSKIPGRKCQAYKVVEQESESVCVDLWNRKLAWSASTAGDPFCEYTRTILETIRLDEVRVGRICLGEAEYSSLPIGRRMAILHWARTLRFGAGTIRRGQLVNRLYSPWTSAPRELRRACFLAGEPIVSIDLQASQPTLIGLLANDETFSEACFNDALYGEIGQMCSVTREVAKQIFLSYTYGRNRTANARNKPAYHVQQYVAHRFPKTHSFVVNMKANDYRGFARELQNLEAAIFINGIYAALMEQKIPSLTVHDSVAVPESRQEEAIDTCRRTLANKLAAKARIHVESYRENTEYKLTI